MRKKIIFQDFENKILNIFYFQSFRLLNLNSYYVDWLLNVYRLKFKNDIGFNIFKKQNL